MVRLHLVEGRRTIHLSLPISLKVKDLPDLLVQLVPAGWHASKIGTRGSIPSSSH